VLLLLQERVAPGVDLPVSVNGQMVIVEDLAVMARRPVQIDGVDVSAGLAGHGDDVVLGNDAGVGQ
jgi:hypothetical protein